METIDPFGQNMANTGKLPESCHLFESNYIFAMLCGNFVGLELSFIILLFLIRFITYMGFINLQSQIDSNHKILQGNSYCPEH